MRPPRSHTAETDGTLATDDLAARRAAAESGIPVTGSNGLLALAIETDAVGVETADRWFYGWRDEHGYCAPVDHIEEVLD